jgi:hypothetical protein
MDTVRNYNRLALDCWKMAERTHDPSAREDMTRLARLWARLADEANKREPPSSGRSGVALPKRTLRRCGR